MIISNSVTHTVAYASLGIAGVRAATGGSNSAIAAPTGATPTGATPTVAMVLAGGVSLRREWRQGTLKVLTQTLLDRHVLGQRRFNVATTWGVEPCSSEKDSEGPSEEDCPAMPVRAVPWVEAPVDATVARCDEACAWLTRAANTAPTAAAPCDFPASIAAAVHPILPTDGMHRTETTPSTAASVLLLCDGSAVPATADGRQTVLATVAHFFANNTHRIAQFMVTSVNCDDQDANQFLYDLAACTQSSSTRSNNQRIEHSFNYYGNATHG